MVSDKASEPAAAEFGEIAEMLGRGLLTKGGCPFPPPHDASKK